MKIWIEKNLIDNYNGKLNGNQLFTKIREYFKHKENWKNDLNIEQEDLTKRKVMLNQNNHYKSQMIPFQYALSISTEILMKLKNYLNKKDTIVKMIFFIFLNL